MKKPQSKGNDSGSQKKSEPAFLVVGKLRRAHGIQGEIPLELYTKMLELLQPGTVVYIGESFDPFTIEKIRWKQTLMLLKFKEISDRTIVSQLTNELLYIRSKQLPQLDEGEFYVHELIGLQVYEEDGTYLGELREVLMTKANDVYLIQSATDEEILIPATEEMILDIDLDQQKMVVGRLEWYGEGDG